jgi:hypothetical protein
VAASAETKARVLALLNPQSTPELRPRSAPGAIRRGAKAAKAREALRAQREPQDDGGGGVGGLFKAAAGNVVRGALETLDAPRRGIWAAGAAGAYGAAKLIGDEERAAYAKRTIGESLSGEYTGSDVLEDAGVRNPLVRGAAGFGIDVATDPLTYVAVGAPLRGGAKVVSQRILREAPERLATNYAEKAGVSLADPLAARALRTEAQRVSEEAATRVAQRGGSSLSADEAFDLLGTRGGIQFTIPGTGRLGRKITRVGSEHQVPLVSKALTDPITHAFAGARTGIRESRWGQALGQRLGGEDVAHALSALSKSGDARIAVPAMKTLAISQTEQARSSVIFRELTREYGSSVRPQIKRNFDTIIDAAESGAKEGAPLRDFFTKVADDVREATNGAIDLRRDGNYVPLIETKAGRAARTAGKQVYEGAGGYDPTTKSRLRALFGDSDARREFEEFAKEKYGLSAAYFERHPDKIVPVYLQVLERKVARELTWQRMQVEGIVKPGYLENRVLDTRNIRKRGKLANKAARATTRAEGYKAKADELLGAQAEQTNKVLGNAGAPVTGPAVDSVDDVDATRRALWTETLAKEQVRLDTASNTFESMGVRELRKIATDQGIKGAHRMRKPELVDELSAKALNGELVKVERAADPALLRAHDQIVNSAFRKKVQQLGIENVDIADAGKYMDSLESLVKRSGSEQAGFHLGQADEAFARGDYRMAMAEAENALSTVHYQALYGQGISSADMLDVEDILRQFPHLADPTARNALLDGLNQSVDQDTANALDEIDRLRMAGDDEGADALAATLPEDAVRFGELSAVGGIHVEQESAQRLNDLFGTRSLKTMLRPALDVDALNRELATANAAAREAEERLFPYLNMPERSVLLEEAAKQQRERVRYLESAGREANRDMKMIGVLSARRAQAEAMYLKETGRALSLEKQRAALATTKIQKQVSDEIMRGTHKFVDSWSGRTAPAEIADALARVSKVQTSEGWSKFLHHYDSFLNYIKAWQISSPGFHVRNTMGGVFNNFLADIDPGSYNRYWRARMGLFSSDADRAAFAEWRKFGSVGQYGSHEITTGLKHENLLTRVNPLSSKNAYVHANQLWGGQVEDMLRGSLFMDMYKKTGDADQALDAVYKFHFNYDDLSQFERQGVKRVFPFYTWTRKNFPLQLQMMVERPGKYAWYNHFEQNLSENFGEPEGIVPQYYSDLWAIPTGANQGGGQMYLTPDLPFTRTMSESLPFEDGKPSLNPILSQMTPIIKTPLERIQGHQYFKNIPLTDRKENAPDAWDKIPGLTGLLGEIGVIDKKGKIAADDAYTIEQYVPLLGRLRRLFPSEKKHQDRVNSTWLSFLGIPLRTNTDEEKRLERFRRYLESTEEVTYRVPKKDR